MNRAALKAAIESWMHREGDASLIAQIDTFIELFEARANRALRVPEMEKRTTLVPASEYLAFPSDYLELRNIQINGATVKPVQYLPPEQIDKLPESLGDQRYYSIVGNEFQFKPSVAGSTVEIAYYAKIPALTDSNTTNWLLDSNPDYYLAGCLLQAYMFTLDDRAGGYDELASRHEIAMNKRGRDKRFSGPMLVMSRPNHVV